MRRSYRIISLFIASVLGVSIAPSVHAQVRTTFADIALGSVGPVTIILNLISWFLGITALLAVVLILYAGFLWISSQGNEEKIEKAKQVLKNALIGLLIIMAAWGIVLYIISVFSDATGTNTTNGDGTGAACSGCTIPSSGSSFSVLSTNPESSETGVVLCTDITVRMSDDVDTETVKSTSFFVQVVNGKTEGSTCTANNECLSSACESNVCVGSTLAGTIGFGPGDITDYFNFVPAQSFEQDTTYEVTVAGGSSGIQSLDTTDDGVDDTLSMSSTYSWTFTTGSDTDTTPPTVEISSSSPYPDNGASDVCLNTVINFDFSEPMRITTFNDTTSFVLDDANSGVPDWADTVSLKGWSFGSNFDYAQARPKTALTTTTKYSTRLYGGDPLNNFSGALTDSCGNALDGDFDGVSEGSTIDNYIGFDSTISTTENPITWMTGLNAECSPIIDSFAPSADYYGEYAGLREGESCTENSDCASNSCVSNVCDGFGDTTLTINGGYFAPHPEVLMEGSEIVASDDLSTCFNEQHLGNVLTDADVGDSCLDDELQTETTIVMRTPVGAAATTPIYVRVAGDTSEASEEDLTVLSPYISSLSPNNGSIGQYVTIVGANFAEDQGSGSVRMVSADGSRISEISLPDACGDVWANDTIIISIPETYQNTDGSTGTWTSGDVAYIQVLNASGKYSDLQQFTFNTIVRPNLCEIVSSCNNAGGAAFYVTGDNFGNSQGDSQVAFASDEDTGYYSDVSSWTATRIDAVTPDSMTQDDYWVSVYDADTQENSNALRYSIPCNTAPDVVDISTCSPDDGVYPVPNPRPDTTDACINANIGVLFDRQMDTSTLNTSHIYLEQYNTGSSFDAGYSPLAVVGHIHTADWSYIYSGNTYYGFQFNVDQVPVDSDQNSVADGVYSAHFQQNTWYQMTITTGVQSTDGVAMAETYTMVFKTQDSSELCAVDSVDVSPSSSIQNTAWLTEPTERAYETYVGSAYAAECEMLDSDAYTWNWAIDNTAVGDFGSGPQALSTQKTYVAGDDAENEGTATLTTDVEGISDTATFTVDLGYCDTDADCSSCSGSVCNEASHSCTPVITNISPESGDNGTWVTLGGCMFGAERGEVTMKQSDGTISTLTDWPDEALCGDTWTNTSVVVEVPAQYDVNQDGTDDTDLPDGAYNFSLSTASGLSNTSTDNYTLNDVTHPGLCLIDPDSEAQGGGVTAYGKGFGSDTGIASFNGVDDYDTDGFADRVAALDANTAWADTIINTIVPSGAVTGKASSDEDGFIVVTLGGDADCTDPSHCSNSLDFVVTCTSDADCSSGICDESGICASEATTTEVECSTDVDCQQNGCSGSTCTDSGVCSPVILSLEEDSGPNGGYTTIEGCYFGIYGDKSSVSFTNDTNETFYADFPCADSWSDTEIIVTVPSATDLPLGTTADVRVTNDDELTTNVEVFTITNTCSNGAPIPTSGVPLLCDLLPSSASFGAAVEFSGDRQVESGQSNIFYNGQEGDGFAYIDTTSTTVVVPENAETGIAQINVNSCVSNGLNFTVTCETIDDCGDGQYCANGTCTSDISATCGACTSGNSDSVCGESQGCYYASDESAYCCGSRPTLVESSVIDGSANVCPNSQFQIEFSEGMTNTEAFTLSKVSDNGDGTYTAISSEPLTITSNDAKTIFTISSTSLDVSTLYMLTVTSSEDATIGHLNGVSTGLSLADGTETYVFTTASSTCVPDHVRLLNDENGNSSYRFSEPNAAIEYTAYMMSSDGQYLAPSDDLSWEFTWDPYYDENRCDNIAWVDTTAEEDLSAESATSESQIIKSGEENNKVETVSVTASALSGWTGSLVDKATVSTFYCNENEAWEYIDEIGSGTYIDHSFPQHFRLIYCDTDELPSLKTIIQSGGSADDWFLQYLFFNPNDKDDAFGIRVYENSEHLSPAAWYAQNVPNPGSPSETTVDGYQAIKDGTSYYVAASNIDQDTNGDGLEELYSNIYLITFNESSNMSVISSQIIEYIRFNWNLSYTECEGSDKNKLIRDTKRITDIGEIASLANTYYDQHDAYPYPQSDSFGSYLEELTTSVWTSWQGALGNVLGSTLPTDPYNMFYASEIDDPWDAPEVSWDYTGDDESIADCEYDPGSNSFYDEAGTCWDPINNTFYCPDNSHVYLWKVDSLNTDNAQLYAHLEYTSSSTETYINADDATEPCSSVDPDSTCSCFNYTLSSELDPGGTWR